MKQKDIIYLVIALAVFAIIGIFMYDHFSNKNSSAGTQVEVIQPINSDFNQQTLSILADPNQAVNYQPSISLDGLGNTKPFGPLQ